MPATQRKPRDERRTEIAAAALRLIGERGATSLTAASLAEAVGVTPGALFRHFATVDEILAAAVDLGVQRVEATFPDEELEPLERLSELVLSRIEAIRDTPGLAWLLLSDQAPLTVPEAAVRRLRRLVKRTRSFLLEALEEGVECGELRDDIAPELMLVLVTGCVHSLAAARGVHARASLPSPDEVLETLLELLAP